ncbi:LCP family protein [Ruminococcus sp.]|uniref:LCP family protein n=1 Tax=Ruminococcus sp. TaxID=41978 RepID=UPI001B70ECB4|nr:LCP family protein [Ruminococcus sp.]MBP5431137.1 LCP family protein [Ruminococcus sp.]
MPHRYNGNDGNDIPNTDNEETMLISGSSDSNETHRTELPPLKRVNRRTQQQEQATVHSPAQSYISEDPPPFPQSQTPPQFPHSSTPPPPSPKHPNYNERDYYDYNQQSPQDYSGGYYPPPSTPVTVPPPSSQQRSKDKEKKQSVQHEKAEAPKKKRKHKSLFRRIIGRIFKIAILLFLLVFCIYSCTSVCLIRKINQVPSKNRIHYADSLGRGHVRSILVIGTDGRNANDHGRSDSMILISLNSKTKEIIMTSFMRDCYVEIPNNGWDKLNAAYAYGGAELLMETIENNFDVRIDDYVSVDFASFVSVVDAVGGVDIEVSDAEAEQINIILISELNSIMGDDINADLLSRGGKLHLNGKQALAYSRIRNVGNNDFERTERQRRVISLIIARLKTFRPSIFKNLASDVIPDITTNMDDLKMYLFSLRAPFAMRYKTKQLQIPAEGTYYPADVDVGSVLQIDNAQNQQIIENVVFSKG